MSYLAGWFCSFSSFRIPNTWFFFKLFFVSYSFHSNFLLKRQRNFFFLFFLYSRFTELLFKTQQKSILIERQHSVVRVYGIATFHFSPLKKTLLQRQTQKKNIHFIPKNAMFYTHSLNTLPPSSTHQFYQ